MSKKKNCTTSGKCASLQGVAVDKPSISIRLASTRLGNQHFHVLSKRFKAFWISVRLANSFHVFLLKQLAHLQAHMQIIYYRTSTEVTHCVLLYFKDRYARKSRTRFPYRVGSANFSQRKIGHVHDNSADSENVPAAPQGAVANYRHFVSNEHRSFELKPLPLLQTNTYITCIWKKMLTKNRPFAQLFPGLETGHPVTVGQSPAYDFSVADEQKAVFLVSVLDCSVCDSCAGD